MAMQTLPPGVEPEVLEDFICAQEIRTATQAIGKPLELWEALCLARASRPRLRTELQRIAEAQASGQAADFEADLQEKLKTIRGNTAKLIKDLRVYMTRRAETPDTVDLLEIAFALLSAFRKGRETAVRWIADPAGQWADALSRMKTLIPLAESYRAALMTRASEEALTAEVPEQAFFEMAPAPSLVPVVEAPPPPPTPPAPAAPAPVKIELPRGVDPEVLEDVRRVEQCRKIFEATHQQIEVWEVFCLVMMDRDATKAAIEELLRLQTEGHSHEFNEGALELFGILLSLRGKHGKTVRALREYISGLQVGSFGKEVMDLAMGFIMASERGRTRVEMWLAEPQRFRNEASGRLEDIISRVMNYQTALRLTSGG